MPFGLSPTPEFGRALILNPPRFFLASGLDRTYLDWRKHAGHDGSYMTGKRRYSGYIT
jgi:hypothetical protein